MNYNEFCFILTQFIIIIGNRFTIKYDSEVLNNSNKSIIT